MRKHTKEYLEYLGSLQWHAKREAALKRSGYTCENCGAHKNLEVHHRHYDTLFNERPEDLRVLCTACHPKADEERRRINHRAAGLSTYATNKYGENWQGFCDAEFIVEEFDSWLEDRAYD